MPRKKVKVDAASCIGCGCCVGTYPDDFAFTDEGQATAVNGEAEEEALSVCPVGAIVED